MLWETGCAGKCYLLNRTERVGVDARPILLHAGQPIAWTSDGYRDQAHEEGVERGRKSYVEL